MTCIEITVAHNPLAFFYRLLTPTIDINGAKERKPWGTHRYELPPGEYHITISYPWLMDECGSNSVDVSLATDETRKVHYCARLIRFLPGAIKVTDS